MQRLIRWWTKKARQILKLWLTLLLKRYPKLPRVESIIGTSLLYYSAASHNKPLIHLWELDSLKYTANSFRKIEIIRLLILTRTKVLHTRYGAELCHHTKTTSRRAKAKKKKKIKPLKKKPLSRKSSWGHCSWRAEFRPSFGQIRNIRYLTQSNSPPTFLRSKSSSSTERRSASKEYNPQDRNCSAPSKIKSVLESATVTNSRENRTETILPKF